MAIVAATTRRPVFLIRTPFFSEAESLFGKHKD
jgi:hypothetical protein